MKRLFLYLAVFLAALVAPVHATIIHLTSVGAAASTIVTPSQYCKTLIIQNNGSGNIRYCIDGGTVAGLTDPTASTGVELAAHTFIIITFPGNTNYAPPVVRAILETATTTTIDIVTDDSKSS
jgi:hypothetical protein